ncbi:MAG: rubrerythrin [Rhizobiales bacterium]|nr:rubrerythrin [Hyphomicrobiales bacterium]MBI3672009.1 rubrerythrin [Hyphomicrobiales bacterium]
MKSFSDLSEQEILALAISSEDDDARAYSGFAHALMDSYPASAKVFIEMAEEEHEHRRWLSELYQKKFGDFIPLIRRSDVIGFVRHKPAWTIGKLNIDAMRQRAEVIELENYRFYKQAAERSSDPQVKKLLSNLAEAEKGHESLAGKLGEKHVTADAKIEEGEAKRRLFLLQVIQPGLVGLMDGSVSTLAPLFAAAFATHRTWETFLVGLAASVGAGISMGLAEGLSDDGKLTGRGHPLIRGLAAGIMTAVGGLGHTLPFLIPDFNLATAVAAVIVILELAAISWIRYRYMDTPFLKAAFQIAVGGFLVFLTGILIGSRA